MKLNTWKVRAAALALAVTCLGVGAALAAGEGGSGDPLITLSYLDEKVVPDIVAQAEKKAETRQKELAAQFDQALEQYKKQVEQLAAGGGGGQSASYAVVTLSNGQQLRLEVGGEVLLRVGSAAAVSPSSPGLVDVTTGGTLDNGASLEKNHLYMATVSDRAVRADADGVKVLVRGGYSVV